MLDPICNGYFWYFNLCVGYGKSWLISGNAQMMVENECNEKGTKVDFWMVDKKEHWGRNNNLMDDGLIIQIW